MNTHRIVSPVSRHLIASLLLAGGLAITGCGDAGNDGAFGKEGNGLNPGVGQGGAQDFGRFRQILEDGEIPGPETIDDVGFFNEHKIELPDAQCGQQVCMHGMLGVMGNMISGSNCTLVLIGMNTPVDPDELERPPLNLSIVVDGSGSMQGQPIQYVREGLDRMLDSLEPQDRITLVRFDDEAEILAESQTGDSVELWQAIQGLTADGGTNVYEGLRTGFEIVADHAEEDRQNRVILLSDGLATSGITDDAKLVAMSTAYNELGYGLTTIGMGTDFDVELMRELAESGAGAFYFLDDPSAVQEVFVEEVESFLVPLAEDAHVGIDIGDGYDLRAVYGTKLFEMDGNEASISIPSLQIAHRESEDIDPGEGRRGGGGAMILELLPTGEDPAQVGTLSFDYKDAVSGELVVQEVDIASPLDPWETPTAGYFSDPNVEKGFVMLNIYVGFQLAATRASVGDDGQALVVLRALEQAVEDWLADNPDDDVEDDLFYVRLFIDNLEERGAATHSPNPVPPEPWPAD